MKEISNLNSEITFNLKNFNGPLDLLVNLVKEKNVDIFDIDLAELATQYLQIIEQINEIDFDLASEYLVMAATLIHLKARIILQNPQEEEQVKKEKIRLLNQIAEYQKFKEISLLLKNQEQERKQLFQKNPSDLTAFVRKIDESVLDGHSSPTRLTIILRKMFERTYAESLKNISLQTKNISPEEMKLEILKLFKTKDVLNFEEVFNVPSMGHFVISWLALLDLSRQQKVIIAANDESEIITISKGKEYVQL